MATKRRTPGRKAKAQPDRAASRKPESSGWRTLGRTSDGHAAGEKLYYRIGEVAKITDVKPYVLRYWESEFRWMAPQKSRSKQRLYRPKDIETILLIKKLLYQERYTIAGARKHLRELGVGKALEVAEQKVDHRAEYRRIRDELQSIRSMLA